jgi:hypothetical protein
MSHYPAIPDEFEALMAQLEPVSAGRRPGIARMIFEALGPCPVCDEPVRRCDRRVLIDVDDDQLLAHLECVSTTMRAPARGRVEGRR